jgi:hypothetical protein
MKTVSISFFVTMALIVSGCNENNVMPGRTTIAARTIFDEDRDQTEGIPESDSWRYPYPTILKKIFIPPYKDFAHKKCIAWRITWPSYAASADVNKIPTVFATANGALNSFDYLNSVDPENTLKSVFSLYYDNKVETSAIMWEELDYADAGHMEGAKFVLSVHPLDHIIDWVTERPDLFSQHWPGGGEEDLSYDEGDIIQFRLADAQLYGGIRIVQMDPRIIEVYLAVPNI